MTSQPSDLSGADHFSFEDELNMKKDRSCTRFRQKSYTTVEMASPDKVIMNDAENSIIKASPQF